MPKVSIILTTYNHKDFIEYTIESVLGQNFNDWELLIGDDSPNDDTWNIIGKYVNKYPDKIRAWHNSPSKMIVGNMNFLLDKKCKDCKFIAFLEGDDLWTENYLSEKIKIFEQYPDVGFVYNDISIIDGKGKIIEKNWIRSRTEKWYQNESDTIGNLSSKSTIFFGYSSFMCRNFGIKINDYGKKDLMGTEGDTFLQVAKQSNLYGIKKVLSFYRKHGNNTSNGLNKTLPHYEYLMNKYIDNGEIDSKNLKKIKIGTNMMRCVSSILDKNFKSFIKYFAGAFKISFWLTISYGARMVWYRGVKPFFYKIFSKY